MERSKSQKNRRAVSVLLKLALLVFCGYMVYSVISQHCQLVQMEQEFASLSKQNEELAAKNADLEQLLENGSQEDFIARAARDKLGYAYANEEVYEDISGK